MTAYTDYADHIDVFVQRRGPKGGLVFPVKLFLLLKYIDLKEPQLKTIISWNHHGRSFKIHDHKQFRQIILPRFYANISKETFRRQLSLWGFRRISYGVENNGSYYHEKFLRSKDYLCRLIRRNETSGPPLPESEEPDFDRMKAMPLSEQHRLTTPESDDELFEIMLLSSNADAAKKESSSNQSQTKVSSNANASMISMNPSLDSASLLHPLNSSYISQESSLLNNSMMESTIVNPTSNHHQLLSAMMTSNAPSSSANYARNSMDPPSLNNSYQGAMQSTNSMTTSAMMHPHALPFRHTSFEGRLNDETRQTYQNIDLEQFLSDENEWRWRNLQPFPIGFQPPLSQSESEEMDRFMSFIRRNQK
ncbi:hypothetical protein CTEN210_18325 [Chaetoceros tenuissimus]|uniref:HSF-type DNA-binding domain-containing protein n=1 Tax=Chaetoceros tenuissimus TaxID=426638 RepID=A0AAD3HG08_9STRA|nr:hypothetical protein CTEN210_18325 [Chaetoceros tenuissimus]